jgi:hypothetical protein
MRRWSIVLILIVVAVYVFYPKERVSVVAPAVVIKTVVQPVVHKPLVLAPHIRRPASVLLKKVAPQSALKIDRQNVFARGDRPALEQSGRRWRWLDGAVAVPSDDPRVAHIPRLSERAGFWVIASGDLPSGMEGLPLVEREDNGLVGIFTGVLKAMGKPGLQDDGQFRSACPCEINQAYPQLKSYLLEVSNGQSHEELKTCLQGTGLFKRLEWEILDHPHTSR